MKTNRTTPPLWRAWVEMLLEKRSTIAMLHERELTVDVVRQIASAEAGLARFGTVRTQTEVLAELLQQPVDIVTKGRLALVHLNVVVFTRTPDGGLARDLELPVAGRTGRKIPPAVSVALDRLVSDG